jgi:AraC-like DNA-binding protein
MELNPRYTIKRDCARRTLRPAHSTVQTTGLGPVTSGQDIHRTQRHVNRSPAEFFQFAVMGDGVGRMSQDGRQAVLRPGDALIYETNRPFDSLFDRAWSLWVFAFPTEVIPLSPEERRLLTARRLDGNSALTGVVTRYLMDLAHHSQELSAGNPQRLVQHASDLIVSLLSEGIEPTDTTRGCIQRTIMLRVKDYIDQHLDDQALTPPEIAASAGISTRYLHKLFESEGQTVSEYVRDRRLDWVHHALLDPGRANLTISTIAMHAGFGDVSGFNRSFRSRYGVTPRELRQGTTPT